MGEMKQLSIESIVPGICFSEPVYFEDGKNMFLAAGVAAKPYHLKALKQWNIPYLLTRGTEVSPEEGAEIIEKIRLQNSINELEYIPDL